MRPSRRTILPGSLPTSPDRSDWRTSVAYLQLSVVACIWGGNYVAAKVLLHLWPPDRFAAVRIALAAVMLAGWATARGQRWRIGARSWCWLILAGLLGIGLNNGLLYTGLGGTSADHGALIMALVPVGTAVALRLGGGEPLSRGRALAVVLGTLGAAVVVLPAGGLTALAHLRRGDLEILGAMASSSASFLFLIRGLQGVDAVTATAVTLGSGALVLAPGALLERMPGPGAGAVWAIALFLTSAVLSMGLGMLWWNSGVAMVGATRTVIFNDVVPAVTLVLNAVWLGVPITFRDILGFVLTAAAIAATVAPERRPAGRLTEARGWR